MKNDPGTIMPTYPLGDPPTTSPDPRPPAPTRPEQAPPRSDRGPKEPPTPEVTKIEEPQTDGE